MNVTTGWVLFSASIECAGTGLAGRERNRQTRTGYGEVSERGQIRTLWIDPRVDLSRPDGLARLLFGAAK